MAMPASIIVANWRLNTTSECSLTFFAREMESGGAEETLLSLDIPST